MTQPPSSPGAPAGSEPPVPHCYRHPDRETYIRCQRCDRPICPECQIPAAVGFQCPDDVRAGNKNVRQARTTLGGVVRSGGVQVTIAILAITVAVSVLDMLIGGRITDELAMRPGLPGRDGILDGQYYRLLTPALVHDGPIHLAVNMYSLWVLGSQLEPLLGRSRFLGLYVVGALGGSAVSFALNDPLVDGLCCLESVGASGAIFALFGAMLPVMRRMRMDLRPLFVLLAINAFIGFQFPNIDWKAHLGGLVVGIALGAALAYAPRERRDQVQIGAFVLVTLAVVAVIVVRTMQLNSALS